MLTANLCTNVALCLFENYVEDNLSDTFMNDFNLTMVDGVHDSVQVTSSTYLENFALKYLLVERSIHSIKWGIHLIKLIF